MDDNWPFGIYLGILFLLASAELFRPLRKQAYGQRNLVNVAMTLIGNGLLRLLAPVTLVAVAEIAQAGDFGLFGGQAGVVSILVSLIVLDFAVWAQHLALHRVPFLWRLHRVHHTDTAVDVTTALRFHPFEYALSLGVKCGVVLAIGAPPQAAILFELLLGAAALFTHANVAVSASAEKLLRRVIVTPSLHAIHHLTDAKDHDRNFGFCLNLWDRLAGCFAEAPEGAEAAIGLKDRVLPEPAGRHLLAALAEPFRK